MFCPKCGKEVAEGLAFCPACGAPMNGAAPQAAPAAPAASGSTKDKVFAYVGMGLGIASLVFCWVFYLALLFGIPGLVFSILGKKCVEKKGAATAGLITSIIGMAIAIIIVIIAAVAIGSAASSIDYYY